MIVQSESRPGRHECLAGEKRGAGDLECQLEMVDIVVPKELFAM